MPEDIKNNFYTGSNLKAADISDNKLLTGHNPCISELTPRNLEYNHNSNLRI